MRENSGPSLHPRQNDTSTKLLLRISMWRGEEIPSFIIKGRSFMYMAKAEGKGKGGMYL